MKKIILIIGILLITTNCFGAVAYDNVSEKDSGLETGAVTSLSWNHTVNSVANGGLIKVGLSFNKTSISNVAVTCDGSAMTSAGSKVNGNVRIDIFYILNNSTGVKAIAASWTTATYAVGGAVSFTGVHQTTPIGTFVSASGASGNPTVDASSAVGDMVIDVVAANGTGVTTLAVVSGQTQRWNNKAGVFRQAYVDAGGSTKPGAASVTMGWTSSGGGAWAQGALPIKGAVATSSKAKTKAFLID